MIASTKLQSQNRPVLSKDAEGKEQVSRRQDSPRDRLLAFIENPIAYMANPAFEERNAKRKILGEPLDLDFAPEIHCKPGVRLPTHLVRMCDAPLLEGDEEKTLFRRMNYLLYRAERLRSKLSPRRLNTSRMDEIDELLAEADQVKNRIISANVRLVISIVKQLSPSQSLFEEMLSDGLLAMMRAVEKFDFDRGFRFSTYATMVIRRQLYRSMKNDHRDRTRFSTGDQTLMSEQPQVESDPRIGYQGWVYLNSSLTAIMASLDERERYIIRARFGFDTDGKKQTLQSLAGEFGVCKERVRQLEKRAMTKLRSMIEGYDLENLLSPEFA